MKPIAEAHDFLSEARLVERAQNLERGAFDQLAGRYRSALFAIAFTRTGHKEDAEDLAQEILATA